MTMFYYNHIISIILNDALTLFVHGGSQGAVMNPKAPGGQTRYPQHQRSNSQTQEVANSFSSCDIIIDHCLKKSK